MYAQHNFIKQIKSFQRYYN